MLRRRQNQQKTKRDMKKIVMYATGFLLLSLATTSCELERCKICKQVVYDNGNVIEERNEAEYCGTELLQIEATPPVTIGNLTTRWECR